MFTNTYPAFCWKNVRCKVKGGLEQQRARFYRGARFRISLILSHRNLVGECLPQTLLYAAWRLRQPRPATELCKLYRRARFWKPLELQPAPAASTEEFFSPAYSTNGRFLSVEKWKGKTLGQSRGLIHLVRWRGFQKFFLRQYQVFEKKCPL